MFVRIIEYLAYSGMIAALLASSLAVFTFLFLNTTVNYLLILLVFTGTLTIYNIDHLRDLDHDEKTNPLRVGFIRANKWFLYLLTGLSLIISIFSTYLLGLNIIPLLIVPFILGLLHRRIKGNPLFSALYITLAWLIVTVFLPAYYVNDLNKIVLFSLVIGFLLFCNAYTASLEREFYALKHIRYLVYLSIASLIAVLALRGNYPGILPLVFFTTVALLNFRDDEDFEIIYFDGLQLSGTVMSILFLMLITL